jgi:hypothetical protein
MRARLLVAILTYLLALPAAAGPWPRAPGVAFVSSTTGIEDLGRGRVAFVEAYGEYGLTGRLVLGAHLRHAGGRVRADLLARWHPLLPGDLALGVTLGARLGGEGDRRPAPLVGAHLGRGTDTRLGNVWARGDLMAVASRAGIGGRAEVELSGQLGLRTDWGGLAMLTLAEHRTRDSRTLKLTPALGYAVSARSTLVLGATLLPRSRRVDGAQLSVWFDF